MKFIGTTESEAALTQVCWIWCKVEKYAYNPVADEGFFDDTPMSAWDIFLSIEKFGTYEIALVPCTEKKIKKKVH